VIQYKCPCCGYDNNKNNPSRKIAELRRNRSKSTRLIMRKAVSAIATNIPSDNNVTKEYFFYQGVSDASDEVVKYGIRIFLNSNAFYKGKGFKYLTHIILNHNSNRDRLKQFERQMIGKPPSVIELKED
jgi:hypothetical protein